MKTIRTKAFVILDGTLLPIDRIAADTPYYSGKALRPPRRGHPGPGRGGVYVTGV